MRSRFCTKCKKRKAASSFYLRGDDKTKLRPLCKPCHIESTGQLALKRKFECYEAYGGRFCRCCGETEDFFLSIDHIKDNGRSEHQGMQLRCKLRKYGYPSGYQILCFNCQYGKRKGNGFCPHHPKIDLRIPQ